MDSSRCPPIRPRRRKQPPKQLRPPLSRSHKRPRRLLASASQFRRRIHQPPLPRLRVRRHRRVLLMLTMRRSSLQLVRETILSPRHRAWALVPRVHLDRVTTRFRPRRAWVRARVPVRAAFLAPCRLARDRQVPPEHPAHLAAPADLVRPEPVPVRVDRARVPASAEQVLAQVHVPVLEEGLEVLQVADAPVRVVAAAAPAAALLVLSVRAVASPRLASQSGRNVPSSSSAKPRRSVALAFLAGTDRPSSRCVAAHRSPTSRKRLVRARPTW